MNKEKKHMSTMIEFLEVGKTYRNGTQALKGVNLTVNEGEIIGLIGPNGAGKTTVVRLILGLLKPTFGSVRIWGHDPYRLSKKEKRGIGFLLDQRGLYRDLTVEENLVFWAKLYSISQNKIGEILKRWNLSEKRNERVKELSSGMEQKLAIARLALTEPTFIIADEPTSNLDPLARKEVIEMLKALSKSGKTVFITSHDLFDIERLCTRIALLRKGEIIVNGSLEEIKNRLGIVNNVKMKIFGEINDAVKKTIVNKFNAKIRDSHISFSKDSVDTKKVVKFLVESGVDVESVEEEHVSLEDMYARIIKEDEE